MGGNHELGTIAYKLMDARECRQLAHGGQGCFRFIQNVETVAGESVLQQGEERFTMGLLVQGFTSRLYHMILRIHVIYIVRDLQYTCIV